MFGLFKKKPVKFPTKSGTDAIACVSLLDLHGSLFCLDNFNILFYKDGISKVLKPFEIRPADPNSSYDDFDAFPLVGSFGIQYSGSVYIYRASFEVLKTAQNTYIKIRDIEQPVFSTKRENGQLKTIDGEPV